MDLQALIAQLEDRYGPSIGGYWGDIGYFREAVGDVAGLDDQTAAEVKMLAIQEIMRRHVAALEGEG